ncbi:MAG: FAD:protein FMN transferase [Bacteriovoracaceae bacterium]
MIRISILTSLFLLIGCTKKDLIQIEGRTMGTTYKVLYLPESNTPEIKVVSKLVQSILHKVNLKMSTYISESELSRVNQGPSKKWLGISRDLTNVLLEAQRTQLLSNGAYDVTIGPLVNLWGFGPKGVRKVPSQQDISNALKKVGMDKIKIDKSKSRLYKELAELNIDLSSLAKGHGVDQVAKNLSGLGVKNFLVEIGGEMSLKGQKWGRPWKVAIEGPGQDDGIQKVLSISDVHMATSGNYRNFFKQDNKVYSHTLDIKTGRPVPNEIISVTVLDKTSCMRADALSTALMAMGKSEAIKLSEKEALISYIIINKGEGQTEIYKSPEFTKLFP